MAEEKETKKSSSVAGAIFWLCLGITLLSFCLYILQINFSDGIGGVMKSGFKGNGTPLAIERAMYINHGYDISWMNSPILQSARVAIHPLFECVDMLLLRFYGLLMMFPLLLALIFVAIFEGRVVYKEKMLDFRIISAYIFHLSKQILFALFGFGFIFAVFPFGLDIPLIGSIPIVVKTSIFGIGPYFWVSNPFNLLVGLALPVVILTYLISSNFTRNM